VVKHRDGRAKSGEIMEAHVRSGFDGMGFLIASVEARASEVETS
jgi:hypothetical protein